MGLRYPADITPEEYGAMEEGYEQGRAAAKADLEDRLLKGPLDDVQTPAGEVTYEVYLRYPDDQGVWHLKASGFETLEEAQAYRDDLKVRRPRYTDSQWRIVQVAREVVDEQ